MAASYSWAGDLAGDVFVLMTSGDVKRGADVAVSLVPPSGFTELRTIRSKYNEQLEQARRDRAAAIEAKREWEQSTQREADAAFRAFHDVVDRKVEPEDPEYIKARERQTAAFAALNRKPEVAPRVPDPDPAEVWREFRQTVDRTKIQTVFTDVNGRFEARGLREGQYHLFAQYRAGRSSLCWLVPVEVKRGAQTVNLTGRNAGCGMPE